MEINIIVDNILEELGLGYEDVVSKKNTLYVVDLVHALIVTRTIKETARLLGLGESGLEHILHRQFKPLVGKSSTEKWDYWLLGLVNLRRCPRCLGILHLDSFSRTTTHISICKECDNARSKKYRSEHLIECRSRGVTHYENNKNDYFFRNAQRRAAKVQATVPWANQEKMRFIYRNCPIGHHVDHIIPLQGKLVSGLHVETNLQYLLAKENLIKGNRFENSDLKE